MTSFFVPGTPVAKGSAKSFWNPKAKRIVTMQDNRERQKPWASMISYTAQQYCKPFSGPVNLTLHFYMPRPKNHYGIGHKASILKATAPTLHTSRPDLDKLCRLVKDALTGMAWIDDSQVCQMKASKEYRHTPGVNITIDRDITAV